MGKPSSHDTIVVRIISQFFRWVGAGVCYAPWTCILLSTAVTVILSLRIPFSPLVNNISDFTPYEARSRGELKVYKEFFSNRGEPKAIYAFCSGKNNTNMLDVNYLKDVIQVLDMISEKFYLKTGSGHKNFNEYCNGFCSLNEPVRHFYSGMQIRSQYGNDSNHLDLGYPITTVLGTKLYMDPNFFGVKIMIKDGRTGVERMVSVADSTASLNTQNQVANNIKELDLIVLQFRAEIGPDVNEKDLQIYEREIVDYFQKNFTSAHLNVYILTDSFITSEIVRAGLSLLPFLAIGFTIMAVFSTVTFVAAGIIRKQMNYHKIILAIMACVCPFMACGATLGGMFWAGFRFGSILCVTPFLVLAIGVDDAYLMVNAWQSITAHRRKTRTTNLDAELKHRITEMLIDTGPSVSITTITNVLAFGIGALTPTPEIQLFSIGNALAVVVDFVFQLTIYAAFMVLAGRYEIKQEMAQYEESLENSEKESKRSQTSEVDSNRQHSQSVNRILEMYCKILSNKFISSAILGLLAVYWYLSVIGMMQIKAELSPHKLFLKDSSIVKVFEERREHIIPYYGVCWILVSNPTDINSEKGRAVLNGLVNDFESLPGSVGKYSTKFFLRDYEDFLIQSEDLDDAPEYDDALQFSANGSATVASIQLSKGNELRQFLEWPEFSFWNGFIQTNQNADGTVYNMTKFLVTTAFHGENLVEWSNRAKLLNEWRKVADKYPELNVTIYEEDAKFLDLIETMVPIAIQSAGWTFVCMFLVTVLFINHVPTLFVATLSILSTSVGVFGIMSWWGADLDPILMSAMVMSIGFSVDIPSHISYHYHQTGKDTVSVCSRMEKTVAAVGFPILQASVSTTLCVLSLFFVDLHMSQLFAKCMLLVVVIGMVHGLVVIPIIFNLLSSLPSITRKRKQELHITRIQTLG